jgi:hypothetical protein
MRDASRRHGYAATAKSARAAVEQLRNNRIVAWMQE